ncbi:hypothetical protein FSP39_015506 [Pinctada imbricata]|uniref:Uncharacterized protein n=1 Tax=Pinctada imbricata TaxID=66713 RepID=A0AA88Y544_PINIB|nr:hypothetical protein FSP39_015506 [Pinctada imbricata]
MAVSLIKVIMVLVLPSLVAGHLCLIHPRQRGDMDISRAGSDTCFRHGAPCGGQNASIGSYILLFGGEQTFIKWQQNFNHYTVGYPGYMDIAIAEYGSDSWQLLAFNRDEYVHAQDHQQNYTAIVVLPNKACDHCVIRARYVSHKPGEQPFYQCSDVAVQQTVSALPRVIETNHQPKHEEFRNAMKKMQTLHSKHDTPTFPEKNPPAFLLGFSYSPFDPNSVYLVNTTMDGQVIPLGQFDFGHGMSVQDRCMKTRNMVPNTTYPFLLDSVMTVETSSNDLIGFLHEGNTDNPSPTFLHFDIHQASILFKSAIGEFDGHAFSGIVYNENDGHFYTFSVQRNESKGFNFVVGQLHIEKNMLPYIYSELIRTEPEPLYVNYQWMTMDQKGNRLFVLMGNENTPDQLKARIYIFDLNYVWKFLKMVELDVSEYTFMSIHYYEKTGMLYAMSPGKWNGRLWTLVEINPLTGDVVEHIDVADMEYFKPHYGGSIFNAINQETGDFYHVLTLQDTNANIIVIVNIDGYSITYSEITNLSHVHNLVLIKNNF